MRKFILLIISAILLLTACSDEPQSSSKTELNYRKITKGVYTKYDPHKFDGISVPKIYAGEYEFIDPDAWCELFNSKPEIKNVDNFVFVRDFGVSRDNRAFGFCRCFIV